LFGPSFNCELGSLDDVHVLNSLDPQPHLELEGLVQVMSLVNVTRPTVSRNLLITDFVNHFFVSDCVLNKQECLTLRFDEWAMLGLLRS